MDNNGFAVTGSQEYVSDTFNSSWNTILEGDNLIFDDNSLKLLLNTDDGVTEPSADVVNVLGLGNEILIADPNASQDLLNSLNFIKDESIEVADNTTVSTSHFSKPASLPASQNWPGDFGFEISFSPQEKKTKGVTWTYNAEKAKLYVAKEAPCPINFSTIYEMPPDVQIRAMALYSSPESASDVVERCISHVGEDLRKNVKEAEHLVRCESPMARYEHDENTKNYSVVIPFDNPPPGQNYSSYIFKFTCFGSCPGPPGPNRRPLMLVFSLEKDNQVIGRQKVDLKICACPGRDSKTEEGQAIVPKKRKRATVESETIKIVPSSNSSSQHLSKKSKRVPDQDGNYTLMTKDKKCFEFLTQMQKYYNMSKALKNLPPDVKKYLENYQAQRGFNISLDMKLM